MTLGPLSTKKSHGKRSHVTPRLNFITKKRLLQLQDYDTPSYTIGAHWALEIQNHLEAIIFDKIKRNIIENV